MQGDRVAARTYRAWKRRAAPPRAFSDDARVQRRRARSATQESSTCSPGSTSGTRRAGPNPRTSMGGGRSRRGCPATGFPECLGTRSTASCVRPGLHRPVTESFLGDRFRLCRSLGRVRLCGLRDRPVLGAIVGWQVSTVKDTSFVEACLRMELWRLDQTSRPIRRAARSSPG